MTEEEWHSCPGHRVVEMVNWAGGACFPYRADRPLSHRKLLLFACACLRRMWPLLVDDRSRAAVAAAEQFANGLIDADTLAKVSGGAVAAREDLQREEQASRGVPAHSWAMAHADAALAASCFTQPGTTTAVMAVHYMSLAVKWWAKATNRPGRPTTQTERKAQQSILRDVAGNPFRPVAFDPSWRSQTAVALACAMYESRGFTASPVLADALEEAGCDSADVLLHLRGAGEHVRGCWVVDAVLGKV